MMRRARCTGVAVALFVFLTGSLANAQASPTSGFVPLVADSVVAGPLGTRVTMSFALLA